MMVAHPTLLCNKVFIGQSAAARPPRILRIGSSRDGQAKISHGDFINSSEILGEIFHIAGYTTFVLASLVITPPPP